MRQQLGRKVRSGEIVREWLRLDIYAAFCSEPRGEGFYLLRSLVDLRNEQVLGSLYRLRFVLLAAARVGSLHIEA